MRDTLSTSLRVSPLPSTSVRFLGFISDSILQAFLVPPDKKDKFEALREELLGSSSAPVKSLQRFAGKALSFSLATPSCKLYVREVFKAISTVAKNFSACCPNSGTFTARASRMGFPRRLVWSLALAIGTSPLCYVIHQRLSESLGSSSGKG